MPIVPSCQPCCPSNLETLINEICLLFPKIQIAAKIGDEEEQKILSIYKRIRRSGRYAPIPLAPAEGWGPFWPLGALQALLGAFGPQ